MSSNTSSGSGGFEMKNFDDLLSPPRRNAEEQNTPFLSEGEGPGSSRSKRSFGSRRSFASLVGHSSSPGRSSPAINSDRGLVSPISSSAHYSPNGLPMETCPACKGKGRVKKDAIKDEELVALIPRTDVRLKKRYTWTLIITSIALVLLAVIVGGFFVYERDIDLSFGAGDSENELYSDVYFPIKSGTLLFSHITDPRKYIGSDGKNYFQNVSDGVCNSSKPFNPCRMKSNTSESQSETCNYNAGDDEQCFNHSAYLYTARCQIEYSFVIENKNYFTVFLTKGNASISYKGQMVASGSQKEVQILPQRTIRVSGTFQAGFDDVLAYQEGQGDSPGPHGGAGFDDPPKNLCDVGSKRGKSDGSSSASSSCFAMDVHQHCCRKSYAIFPFLSVLYHVTFKANVLWWEQDLEINDLVKIKLPELPECCAHPEVLTMRPTQSPTLQPTHRNTTAPPKTKTTSSPRTTNSD